MHRNNRFDIKQDVIKGKSLSFNFKKFLKNVFYCLGINAIYSSIIQSIKYTTTKSVFSAALKFFDKLWLKITSF